MQSDNDCTGLVNTTLGDTYPWCAANLRTFTAVFGVTWLHNLTIDECAFTNNYGTPLDLGAVEAARVQRSTFWYNMVIGISLNRGALPADAPSRGLEITDCSFAHNNVEATYHLIHPAILLRTNT